MNELKEKRSLNAKHFEKEDGSFELKAHAGAIHYYDKLDSKRWREIDHKLVWDDTKKGWTFKYNSFHPLFPEYSDSFAEFRDLFDDKDQIVKYKAIGESVKGELIDVDTTNPNFDDNIDNKAVLYKNAFGIDRDYLLYNTRSSMVKVGTVNNPNEQTEDAVFEWEVKFPEKDIFRVEKSIDAEEMTKKGTQTNTEKSKLVGYRLDKTRNKTFNTNKQTLIGNSKLDGKEWFTYLKSYKAWDSEGNTIPVEAKLYNKDGKYVLKKIIPLEFLKKAVGRVFTDTTTSYYAGAGDGFINSGNFSTWDLAHDNTSGTISTGPLAYSGMKKTSTWGIYRAFFPFDTSSIGGTSTISSASLFCYVNNKSDDDNDGDDFQTVVQTTQANPNGVLIGADYIECGDSVDNPTEGITSRKDITSITTGQYLEFILNATGISWIDKINPLTTNDNTKGTRLGIREGHDILNHPTVNTSGTYVQSSFYTSEETGTNKDPYISVTYSSGGTTEDDANFFGMNF